ncbi:MAG: TIGR00269 family protein [Candidatus Diapherotrites archaeon]
MHCQRCTREGVIILPYGPHFLCEEHFLYFFEHRIRNVTRTNAFFKKEDRIAVAVSGGKDSVVALNLIKKIMPRNEIIGISIDEGIEGYRNKAIEEAIKNYKKLDIPYKIVQLKKEIGNTMQEIVQKTNENKWKENSCTFCGVFRRKYINKTAREIEADKLVTGHNLDDEAQSILMNITTNRMERLSRMGPKVKTMELKEWVPRVKPLYDSPEEEVELFARMMRYPFYGDACCPFSHGADRNIYRMMIDQMEMKKPGSKQGIIKSFLQMKPFIEKMDSAQQLQSCSTCGDLSSQQKCQACQFEKRIRETVIRSPSTNPHSDSLEKKKKQNELVSPATGHCG